KKLPPAQIADLAAWVKQGAPWPNAKLPEVVKPAAGARGLMEYTDKQTSHWAFQPIADPPLPEVKNNVWPQSPVDRFLLTKLEEAGVAPSPPADKRTLLRRGTFDLTGLPPTPEEIDAFLADESPDALARVVDRLLASPRYGEKYGRHWLDLARYGDSNGLDENLAFANAFRYRDYVIGAFNNDKPYDRFVQEQIAGDLLPHASFEEELEGTVATGFLSLGAKMLAEDDPVKMQMDIIDEQIDTLGKALLGLTLGCARCHDHKYDPVDSHDYYALAGIFKSTKTMENHKVVAVWQERPLADKGAIARRDEIKKQLDAKRGEVNALVVSATESLKAERDKAGGELPKEKIEESFPDDVKEKLKALKGEAANIEKSLPQLPEAMAVSDAAAENVRIHIRGSHLTLGEEVPRRFVRIVAGEQQPFGNDRSGRLELAQWLTRPDHPLTSRVMVNRLWQWHFGDGLVRSSDNFGLLGEMPTHPELLDWLARRFVADGWGMKKMQRRIMLSAAYQQGSGLVRSLRGGERERGRGGEISSPTPPLSSPPLASDPDNRLLSQFPRRRLTAEEIRDSILLVSGQLDSKMGGSYLPTANRQYVTSTANVNPAIYNIRCRSVYVPVVRSALYEVFQAFDFADPSVLVAKRDATTVAPQALFMLNSQVTADASRLLAAELLARGDLDDAGRVRELYERSYGRPASDADVQRGIEFVAKYAAAAEAQSMTASEARSRAWQALCRGVMAANEFVYVE
ncbi:MAG TPA: DUF1553 domain-containing protein, partial [Pirellulaceae bacterium]|nr:DUF1553 domain-containing protein [Pirellulaceae bacterium]